MISGVVKYFVNCDVELATMRAATVGESRAGESFAGVGDDPKAVDGLDLGGVMYALRAVA